MNQIHHGLSLREVHFAIQKGTLGEFTRFSGTRPTGKPTIQNTLSDENAAVTVEFDDILTGIARRAIEIKQQTLIECGSVRIDHGNKLRPSWCNIQRQPGDP